MKKQIDTPTNTPTNTPTQNQFTNYESKQIEEMEKIVSNCIQKWLNNDTTKSISCYVSEEIYNAGYRKDSDVAREIVNDVKETLLDFHLREDKKYSAIKTKKRKQFDIETARYRAITDAIKFAIETLNEIEKKYESECGE